MIRKILIGSLSATLLAGAASTAHAQGLSSIFNCNASGSSQTGGAVIGGLLGGLAGAGVAKNDAVGAVLGAAVGAAAGSWVGCRLGSQDQVSLDDATQRALNDGRSTTWSNPQTGAFARINVLADTTPSYGYQAYDSYAPRYGEWLSPSQVRLAPRISIASGYETAAPRQHVLTDAYIRTAPSVRARTNGRVYAGDVVEVLGKVRGSSWLVVARNGVGIGYAPESSLTPVVEQVTASPYYGSSYAAEVPRQSIRLDRDVRWADSYETAPARYSVSNTVYLQAEPAYQSRSLGSLYRGQQVDAIGRVRGTSWILVGRDGYGIGYVQESQLSPLTPAPTYASTSSDCRIVEQELTTPGYGSTTQRYRACRDYAGRWSMASL